MLHFEPVTPENVAKLKPYYHNCDYRLCEYSVGTKLMWSYYLHPSFTEVAGCLVICNHIEDRWQFDFPVAGEAGDVELALQAIEKECTRRGIRPILSVVPAEKASLLMLRYPIVEIVNERAWKDYLYRTEDLANFAGRRYSGQRNHINKFRREHPNARFIPLTAQHQSLIDQFWRDYEAEFQKDSDMAQKELEQAEKMLNMLDTGWFCAGGLLDGERLVAISLAEKCGSTLIVHIEKALYSCAGAYPTIVQAFAKHFGGDCQWINREDDARDRGLRTSKLQYLPAELGNKMYFAVGCELDVLEKEPTVETQRLMLTPFTDADRDDYNTLCLDDERNRWWGYDYHDDLQGEWTEDYFLNVVREDFAARRAVNFAVRLDGRCIGEAVLYNFDWRGGAELGCRIAPPFAGHGYGTEAFAAVADWALYQLGLAKVVAKCFHENTASYKMLSSCMRKVGADDRFDYFEKLV